MYGASERKPARMGLAPHNSLHGVLPGTVIFFSKGKLRVCFWYFYRVCVRACLLLVLSVCFHGKELAEAFPPFLTLRT